MLSSNNSQLQQIYGKFTLRVDRKECDMDKYLCEPCGYIYDPEVGDPDGGIAPGTAFEDIPDDWVCPVCGASKDAFVVAD